MMAVRLQEQHNRALVLEQERLWTKGYTVIFTCYRAMLCILRISFFVLIHFVEIGGFI